MGGQGAARRPREGRGNPNGVEAQGSGPTRGKTGARPGMGDSITRLQDDRQCVQISHILSLMLG